MTSLSLSAAEIREELWRSLVSMLRVYASAATLSRGKCQVTEITPGVVLLQSADAELELRFQSATGLGSWTIQPEKGLQGNGNFVLSEAGTLQMNSTEKELDQAAIEWVEDLTRRAVQRQAS